MFKPWPYSGRQNVSVLTRSLFPDLNSSHSFSSGRTYKGTLTLKLGVYRRRISILSKVMLRMRELVTGFPIIFLAAVCFVNYLPLDYANYLESKQEDAAPRYFVLQEGRDYSLKSGRSNEACTIFAKGRCRMGASCKFVHENFDEHGKVFVDELNRERDIDRRHRKSSFAQGGHGPNRGSDTLCKFFANGNCRNGKYCRFSHDRQACRSPNRRLRDDRRASNPGGDHHRMDRPKLSDSDSPNRRPRDDRWGSDGNKVDAAKVWDSPKWNDTVVVSDSGKLVEGKSENVGATEPGFTSLPTRYGWSHSLDKSRVHREQPFSSDKEVNSWSIGTDIWLGDTKMSPDWHYRVGSSNTIEEKHEKNKRVVKEGGTYLATSEHDRIQIAAGQGTNQNAESLNPLHSSGLQAVGQSQVPIPILPSKGGIVHGMPDQEVSIEKKYTAEPNIGLSQISSRNLPPTENLVGQEKLAQLTNLSASLAHILGTGQQLPQLYSALNSHYAKDTSSLAKAEVSAVPISNTIHSDPAVPVSNTFIHPDPAVGLLKQYDPMCDGVEPKSAATSGLLPSIPPSKRVAEDVLEIQAQLFNTSRQNNGDSSKAAGPEELVKSYPLVQSQSGQNTEVGKDDNKEVIPEERHKSRDDPKSTIENDPLENIEQTGGPDEAKKTKDLVLVYTFPLCFEGFQSSYRTPNKDGPIINMKQL
ncbi:hypothetical protein V8G54_005332 [Vigna mungo]|uniref:C3H1-type domain-containing protein n=1 Tax=Vigna mungo TaxID=3915 RepID=A0AAQ3NZ10_VIGMU